MKFDGDSPDIYVNKIRLGLSEEGELIARRTRIHGTVIAFQISEAKDGLARLELYEEALRKGLSLADGGRMWPDAEGGFRVYVHCAINTVEEYAGPIGKLIVPTDEELGVDKPSAPEKPKAKPGPKPKAKAAA